MRWAIAAVMVSGIVVQSVEGWSSRSGGVVPDVGMLLFGSAFVLAGVGVAFNIDDMADWPERTSRWGESRIDPTSRSLRRAAGGAIACLGLVVVAGFVIVKG